MATITSAQTGNWSATTTWAGGVVPTAADDVRIVGNHVIAADVDITVLSITKVGSGFFDSSVINVTTSRNITCTSNSGIGGDSSASPTINISAGIGQTVNIVSNISILSNYNGGIGSMIGISGQATVNIIGNIINNNSTADALTNGSTILVNTNNAILNITGNITGGAFTKNAIYVNNKTSVAINITGNLQAAGGSAISGLGSGTVIINGNISASASNNTINSSGIIFVIGGTISNNANRLAVYSTLVQISSTTNTQWLFQTNNALVTKTLYDVNTLPTIPTVNNVRSGVTYASGALTGTLVVPPANAVTAGVTYDNGTVGTAQNTAASFLTALAASSDPLAVRLKNVATVQTTGDQIAAAL